MAYSVNRVYAKVCIPVLSCFYISDFRRMVRKAKRKRKAKRERKEKRRRKGKGRKERKKVEMMR